GGGAFGTGASSVLRSTFTGNKAGFGGTGSGGGLKSAGGTIDSSTFSDNTATKNGGGIRSTEGSLTIVNSTISGNTAQAAGGGVSNTGSSTGTILNSTIVLNQAGTDDSGGIRVGGAGAISTIKNSIVAGNINGEASSAGGLTSGGFNIFGINGTAGTTGFTLDADDLTASGALDTLINPTLANNGGLTETHDLVANSLALGSGNLTICQDPPVNSVDQRGIMRPQPSGDLFCDVGSVESDLATPL
ncbi:MAG: hypothetical protein HC924_07960, partial [Synechococcaceae cyanobacterium SM2_3_2]|nr:hypothetical protein [Synechococcaceae cyanobacterium SM2_3_2]